MSGLVSGILFVIIGILRHIIGVKRKKVAMGVKPLVFSFIETLAIIIFLLPALYFETTYLPFFPRDWVGVFHSLLFFITMMMVYVIFFPGIEFESPSNRILMTLYRSKKSGVSSKTIHRLFSDQDTIGNRLDELLSSNKVVIQQGNLFVTEDGRNFLRVFDIVEKIWRTKGK